MTERRSGASMVTLNGYLYMIGGNNGQERLASVERFDPLASVERFDPFRHVWELCAPLKIQREYFSAVVLNGRIYVMGGNNDRESLQSVERYDATRDRWELVAQMNQRRSHFSAIVM
eukprot:g74684.t1